jgi:hypothetical protein
MTRTSFSRARLALVLLATAVVAVGCASGPNVRADYDRGADFSKYRTFGFVSQPGSDGAEFKTLATQMLQAAATREMEARGYRRADQNPDLLINFKGKLEEKTDIESTPAPYYGPGWGYGGWYGSPYGWGGPAGGTQVTTRRYNVGTLVMDIVDRERRQAVFQGAIEGVVTKEMMKNKQVAIDQAVAHIFGRYPFVAGQGTPATPADQKK